MIGWQNIEGRKLPRQAVRDRLRLQYQLAKPTAATAEMSARGDNGEGVGVQVLTDVKHKLIEVCHLPGELINFTFIVCYTFYAADNDSTAQLLSSSSSSTPARRLHGPINNERCCCCCCWQ